MSNKATPLQIVDRYYNRLLEYEKAGEKNFTNPEEVKEKLSSAIQSGVDVDEAKFKNLVSDMVVRQAEKRADIEKAAIKFAMYTDFYLKTQEEELPEEVLKAYERISIQSQMEEMYVIENDSFIKKNGKESNASQQQIDYLFELISKQLEK
jgi:hypothetical protein|tara:strand:- start:18587 stop:19039 length:453 start_codon:yes stop_codon:yes gene_type:complete